MLQHLVSESGKDCLVMIHSIIYAHKATLKTEICLNRKARIEHVLGHSRRKWVAIKVVKLGTTFDSFRMKFTILPKPMSTSHRPLVHSNKHVSYYLAHSRLSCFQSLLHLISRFEILVLATTTVSPIFSRWWIGVRRFLPRCHARLLPAV